MTIMDWLAAGGILVPLITWGVDRSGLKIPKFVFLGVIILSAAAVISAGVLAFLPAHPGDQNNQIARAPQPAKAEHPATPEPQPASPEQPAKEQQPQITVSQSPGSIIAPSGGVNKIINQFGPPQRSVSTAAQSSIQAALKAEGPHQFIVVDYSGGTNLEVKKYARSLAEILLKAGWTPFADPVGTFSPVGGSPMIGLHILTHSNVVPEPAKALVKIFAKNHIIIDREPTVFPMFAPSDDVVAIAVGLDPATGTISPALQPAPPTLAAKSAPQAAPSAPQPGSSTPCTVSSKDQSGGVTACNVGTVNQ